MEPDDAFEVFSYRLPLTHNAASVKLGSLSPFAAFAHEINAKWDGESAQRDEAVIHTLDANDSFEGTTTADKVSAGGIGPPALG